MNRKSYIKVKIFIIFLLFYYILYFFRKNMKTIYFIEKKTKIQKLVSLLFHWIYFSFISEKKISIESIERMLAWKNEIEVVHSKNKPWFYLSNTIREFYRWVKFDSTYVLKWKNEKEIEKFLKNNQTNKFYIYYFWWILILKKKNTKKNKLNKLKFDFDDILYVFFKKDKENIIENFIENKL